MWLIESIIVSVVSFVGQIKPVLNCSTAAYVAGGDASDRVFAMFSGSTPGHYPIAFIQLLI